MNYFIYKKFLFLQAGEPFAPAVGFFDVLWMLLQTAFALALVCGLAILIFRYLLPKFNLATFKRSIVRVVDGASLDARKRLVVVEVAGKYLLLAISESGVQLISELDARNVEEAVEKLEDANREANPQFKKATDSFAQIMSGVWKKRK